MPICTRCQGYVNTRTYADFDPSCINCGCSYPELATSKNGKSKGLKETIRYTGNTPHMKGRLAYLIYAEHPNRGSLYPKLIVECPMCTREAEVITATANPSMNTESSNGYRTAKQSIMCSTGHRFRLKMNKEGIYSWTE